MFNKDNKYKLNTSKPEKKAKKEKAPKEKSESGKLFGGKGFGKESGGKLSGAQKKERKGISFDFLKRKEKGSKISNDFSKGGGKLSGGGSKVSLKERFSWVKWWHIVIAAVVLVIIIVGIIIVIALSGGGNGSIDVDDLPPPPETEGTITTVGTFTPNITEEFILCEYKEYFSGKTVLIAKNESEVLHNYQAYWLFIEENGYPSVHHNTIPENMTPEQIKTAVLNMMGNSAGYTPEIIAKCDVHVYQPVSFTKVKLSSATLTSDNKVTAKYQAGAVDGELSAEYTLNGTYTQNENNFTFNYTNLPEDASLRNAANKLLASAKYESYIMYGSWVNSLTFCDGLELQLITSAN